MNSSQLDRLVGDCRTVKTSRPAPNRNLRTKENPMATDPNQSPDPDRSARLQLAAAALRGILAGAARAITTWLIEEHMH
jgi:hypothetical protein